MQCLYRCDKCDCDFTPWQQDEIDRLQGEVTKRGKTLRELMDKLSVYRRSLKIIGIKYKYLRRGIVIDNHGVAEIMRRGLGEK